MGEDTNLLYLDKYKRSIEGLKFKYKRLTVVEEDGLLRNFMFIVLRNEKKKTMKVLGYSKYFFSMVTSNRLETLEYHAKIIVSFLNYIFFEKYEEYKMKDISELKIEYGNHYLRDYGQGRIGKKKKTKATVEKAENVLTNFYKFIFDSLDNMEYISIKDFAIRTVVKRNKNGKGKEVQETLKSLFKVLYPEYIPPQRIKHIPTYVFQEMLTVCDIYYPHLKLALCLQAFGGLRRGEVCNTAKPKISYSALNSDIGWFTIDLREKTQMRTDGVDVGGIKKSRIQPIHPIFLSMFQEVYSQHMLLIKHLKNPFGAIFLNRDGEAMTQESYEDFFYNIKNYTIERLSKRGDFKATSEAKLLMSGGMGTHVLRHFFTQFIAELEATGSPVEVAYWRGDSSLDSAIIYYSQHPVINKKIKMIQEKLFENVEF